MSNVIKLAPEDTVVITVSNDVDINEYQAVQQKFAELLRANVVVMPEYLAKDITVFHTEFGGCANMFLNGEWIRGY